MIKAVLIDDEPIAVSNLTALLSRYEDVQILGTANGVATGVKLIEETGPDVVFLDVEMGDGTGFDLLEQIKEINFRVVLVTAYDEYAIKAIRYSAMDYLLKPIDTSELSQAIERLSAFDGLNLDPTIIKALVANYLKKSHRLVLPSSTGYQVIDSENIAHCEADDSYTRIYLTSGEKILTTKHLGHYDEVLGDVDFFRIHRSHLININYIESYNRSKKMVRMQGGTELPISKYRVSEFHRKMGK